MTIWRDGQKILEETYAEALDHHTGTDVNGDGIYEFLTCDDSFGYRYCPFYDSPLVRVVLRYELGVGYVPAGPQFPDVYAEEIVAHTALAETARRREGPFPDWPWYGTPRCEVLALVLDYLYSGQVERAWEALYHYYRHPDVEGFRAEIEATVWGSSYFVPPPSVAIEPGEGR